MSALQLSSRTSRGISSSGSLLFQSIMKVVTNQSVPIVLAVSDGDKARLESNKAVVLRYQGVPKAVLRSVS